MSDKKDYFLLVAMFKSCRHNKINLNSASAFLKYQSKKYDVYLINACGEWDQYLNL